MEEGKQLIIQAFRQARDSGKPDWYRMTTAVLKNRLLAITNRNFSESNYGASSFADFVSRFSDVLEIDKVKFPAVVELKTEERTQLSSGSVSGPSGNIRIKRELWRAVFDRSSGNTYYWLADIGVVGTSPTGGNCPVVPTIDAETDRQWRQSFVESLPSIPAEASEWARYLLPLSRLPQNLKYEWNRTLTKHVYERLSRWFEDQGLDPPPDFVVEVKPRQDSRSTELDALRRLIQRVVQEMTEEELSRLSLPPLAVLKATSPRRP